MKMNDFTGMSREQFLAVAKTMFDQYEVLIEECGCAIVGVLDEKGLVPPFTYSVGLSDKGWPELIMVGIHPETATAIINGIVRKDEKPVMGAVVEGVASVPLRYGPVDVVEMNDRLTCAKKRQELRDKPPITALQIVFPDENGNWPEDEGYGGETALYQTILGKFEEAENDN